MKKQDLLALAGNPNLIPGIYNYCDRWCERCSFNQRCLTYMSEQQDRRGPFDDEFDAKSFTEKLMETFSLTHELLDDIAEEHGIDISFTDEELYDFHKEYEAERKTIDETPLSRMAKQYMNKTSEWLNHSSSLLKGKGNELNRAFELGLPNQDPESEANKIAEALKVLSWYVHQIFVKLHRAQHGKNDDILYDDDGIPFPKDSDGSAKVALIGIDNSFEAWQTLLDCWQEQEEIILSSLSLLERLRVMVGDEFPEARSFKRPGFDD